MRNNEKLKFNFFFYSENRKLSQEHHEALKLHRLQVDTLNNCFKNQIEEIQRKHEGEMQKKHDQEIAANSTTATKRTDNGAHMSTEQRIELLMMERQDGEGSECTTTSTHARKISSAARSKHEFPIPLDELLNNTFNEELPNVEQDEHDEKVVPKEKFEAQQSRYSLFFLKQNSNNNNYI